MIYIILIFKLIVFQVSAIEPDEVLENEKLEKIARNIGKELRCLVCQNEDIQNSNADIAKDLRSLVRSKLMQGESKDQIINYIHSRYGDFVLFNPPIRFDTSLLWLLPIIFLTLLCYTFFRKKN